MKVEINIPSDLSEVTLEQYQRFAKIEEPTDIDFLNCFLGLSRETISKMKHHSVILLINKIKELLEQEPTFISKFTLNGITFGFIPKLDDITYGENNDITNYINDVQTLHKAMAVLFRPIEIDKRSGYLIEEYKGSAKYSELMKQMPLDVALGAIVFFYNLTNALLKAIPNYLEREARKLQANSQGNGEDIMKLIHSLKGTLDDLMKLQDFHYTLVYSS